MTLELRDEARGAIQVITDRGQRLAAGRAMLFVFEQIGWFPSLARVAMRRPFIWLVELGYWVVAHNRSFFGRFLFRSER